jgi:hypothetical protein
MANHDFDANEWTPEERALFDALPTDRIPPVGLKARTIDAIALRRATAPSVSPRKAMAIAVAASLIFIAGALVGYAAARRPAKPINDARAKTQHEAVVRADKPTSNNQPTRHVVWY